MWTWTVERSRYYQTPYNLWSCCVGPWSSTGIAHTKAPGHWREPLASLSLCPVRFCSRPVPRRSVVLPQPRDGDPVWCQCLVPSPTCRRLSLEWCIEDPSSIHRGSIKIRTQQTDPRLRLPTSTISHHLLLPDLCRLVCLSSSSFLSSSQTLYVAYQTPSCCVFISSAFCRLHRLPSSTHSSVSLLRLHAMVAR